MQDPASPPTQAIDAANAGRRLDSYLRALCPQVPLGSLMRLLRRGTVRLNGRRAAGATRLQAGDALRLPWGLGAAAPPAVRRRPLRLQRLHEDADLLVVIKPAGVACHPGTAQREASVIEQVQAYLGPAAVGHRPGLAQRLDAGVSGVLAIGKHAAALRQLGAAVAAGSCHKVYLALVRGQPRRAAGRIDVPLRVDDQPCGSLPRSIPDAQLGKPAVTDYRVVQGGPLASLLEVRIHTGRTHQIRAHLRYLGHPILGDPRYGDAAHRAHLHATYGLSQVALHAAELHLPHPQDGRPCCFLAPLPAAMRRLLPGGTPDWAALPAAREPPATATERRGVG